MPANVIDFIWKYSRPQQLWLIGLTFISFPLLYLSLEIPKVIINEALSGVEETRTFLLWKVEPFTLLMLLSLSLLALVLTNGVFKMYVNTQKGIVGEALVRRLRYMLMQRLLRFTPRKFERLSQGEVITTVVQETDPIGGFSGDAFANPLFQAGTLLTILLFMFMQSWMLGFASILSVPLQLYIIPRLQRQINLLRKQRVRRVRALSNRIGETVGAVSEIHVHGTQRYTLAEFSYRFGELYTIRLALFKKKFFMKFVNNTLNQMTPFLFYAIGGYLVLQGQLTVGALVAAIAAHKDFISPWRELLNFYQIWQDNTIRYQQVVEQFSPRQLLDPPLTGEPVDPAVFQQPLRLQQVSIRNNHNEPVLNHLNLELKAGEWIAVTGPESQFRLALARCLTGLDKPHSGFVGFGERALTSIPDYDLRLNVGYLNAHPFMFNAAVSYNIAYGLNHKPPPIETAAQQKIIDAAVQTGNSSDWFDETFESYWSDLEHLGGKDWQDVWDWLTEVMDVIQNREILLKLSLNEVFNPLAFPPDVFEQLVDDLLVARKMMLQEITQSNKALKINHYLPGELNRYAPMLDNIIFGTLAGNTEDIRPLLLTTITETLEQNQLLERSLRIAERGLRKLMLQLRTLPEAHPFMDQFDLHDAERVAHLKKMSNALDGDVDAVINNLAYRSDLIDFFLRLIPQDWLEIWLDPDYLTNLLALRPVLMEKLEAQLKDQYFPFVEDKYNPGLSVINNVLYGRLDPSCDHTRNYLYERSTSWIFKQVADKDLLHLLIVNTEAGVGGSRLPEVAQHSVSLNRTLLKKPSVLVLQDALGNRSEADKFAILQRLHKLMPKLSCIWICESLHPEHASQFNQVFELKPDGLVEQA